MHKFNIKSIEKLDNPERRKMMPSEETLLKFDVKDDGNFLDAGCGIGYFTVPAAKLLRSHKVIGADILQEMLDTAKESAAGINNVEFRKSGECSLPVDDGSMRYILVSNVIHEVEDKLAYFYEMRRAVQDDGFVLIIDWEKRDMKMGPPSYERVSSSEMIELGKQSGFKLVKEIGISENHYGIKLQKNVDR